MTAQEARLLADSRLTDAARLIGLRIAAAAGEWVEWTRDDFRRLLHGAVSKDRVARALGELELYRYIERREGGRGHGDSFRFTVQAAETVSDSVQATKTVTADSVQAAETVKRASTTPISTPPPSPSARAPETDLARLRMHLGEHGRAVDLMAGSAAHPPTWAAAVYGKFGPDGMHLRIFGGLPPDRRAALLASALTDYATDGKRYDNRHFEGYVRKAITNEHRSTQQPLRATGTDGHTGGAPGQAGGPPAGGADRGQVFRYE